MVVDTDILGVFVDTTFDLCNEIQLRASRVLAAIWIETDRRHWWRSKCYENLCNSLSRWNHATSAMLSSRQSLAERQFEVAQVDAMVDLV